VTEPVDAADPDTGSDADAEPEDGYEDEPPPAEETHSEHPLASYVLRVNGADRPVTDAWLGESLLYVLRERLGLAGAKDGCEQGECGACSVQVDGRLVASCLVPAATAAGSEVRTVEGLSGEGGPCDIQRALADCGAVQCGFCIPGMAMTVHDLLEGNHRPTDLETRQALSGNLCRCTGYRGVVEAVRQVVAARDGEDPPPAASRIPAQSGPSSPEAAV
jgi:aerobic-type carbon monoxide dehydrogenase small subunit (CoxS/CutS family)